MIREERGRFLNERGSQVGLDRSIHPLAEMMLVAGDQIVSPCKDRGGEHRRILSGKGNAAGQVGPWNIFGTSKQGLQIQTLQELKLISRGCGIGTSELVPDTKALYPIGACH